MDNSSRRFSKVAVLMGGMSSERDVSLRSGAAVARGLRESGYTVEEVDIRDADFVIPKDVEAAFLTLHGAFGEDGRIQEILNRRQIPYTGSGVESSKISFDKMLSKKAFEKNNIPTPKAEYLRKGGVRTLALPLVVKPSKEGSSIGITRVFEPEQWNQALEEALKYDAIAVVEEYIAGLELTVGLVDGEPLQVIQIRAPGDWYSFQAKYTKGQTEYLVPAPIPPSVSRQCQEIAVQVYRALGNRGLGRVDLRMREDGALFVLEMNTIPGFTETSLLPKAALCSGMSFGQLCDRIMRTAKVDDV